MTKTERRQVQERRRENPNRGIVDTYNDVRRWNFFRADLSARVKADKRRSRAAKKGWKTRRAS